MIPDPVSAVVGHDELASLMATEPLDRQIRATPDSEVHAHVDGVPETLHEVFVGFQVCLFACSVAKATNS